MSIGKSHRYLTLDGIRGVAAIAVMLYHYAQQSDLFKIGRHQLLSNADLAVDLFFVLSGFVIAHSYGRRLRTDLSPRDYVLKRIIRLYPLYAIGLLLGALVLAVATAPGGTTAWTPLEIAKSLGYNLAVLPYPNLTALGPDAVDPLRIGDVFPGNPPAWSLFFEFVASLAFVFLFDMHEKTLLAVALVALAVYVAFGLMFGLAGDRPELMLGIGWGSANFVGGFPRVLYGFTVGLLIGRTVAETHPNGRDHAISETRVALLFLVVFLLFLVPIKGRGLYPLVFVVAIAPAVVYLGSRVECGHPLAIRLSDWFGRLSYPVYCLHFPIGRLVWFWGDRAGLGKVAEFAIATTLALIVSFIVGNYVDQPVRRLLSRLSSASKPATA